MAESPDAPRRAQPFQAPKGTQDILPPDSDRWQALIARFAEHVGRAGYGLLQSPMFEEMGVFSRVGEGTDVVRKEMYDFLDKGGRHIALRPEGTASVVRAFVQHRPPTPWKVWYAAPSFRYERAQANRYRQHHQLGAEALGPADPDLDVEVVAMLHDFYRSLGLRQIELVVNSIGTPADRRTTSTSCARSWSAASPSSIPTTRRRSRPTRCGCSTRSAPAARRWWPTRPC